MVLNGGDFQAGSAQNLIGPLDLSQIMVGYANGLDLPTLRQGDEHGRPPLHIHGIVNPIHIHHIGVQTLFAAVQHFLHGRWGIACNLRGELGREDHLLTGNILHEIAEDTFGGPLAVDGGGVPQVQAALEGRVKHGLQIILKQMAPKDLIAASRASAPGPCTKRNFRRCIHYKILLNVSSNCSGKTAPACQRELRPCRRHRTDRYAPYQG